MEITYGVTKSPFGKCVIGTTKGKICYFSFLEGKSIKDAKNKISKEWPEAKIIENEKYIKGFSIKLFKAKKLLKKDVILTKGTPFQIKVWNELLKIPKGKTSTYKKIAEAIGAPKASRAVGTACGKNYIPYIIPCHRVLSSGGNIGGYSGGINLKRDLLKFEKISI